MRWIIQSHNDVFLDWDGPNREISLHCLSWIYNRKTTVSAPFPQSHAASIHLRSASSKPPQLYGSLRMPCFIQLRRVFPDFHFIILKSPRMQSDARPWLISKPLILFSFEENIMDGSKQGIIGQSRGSAWPANNPDLLPRLAASLGNIVH